jgi:long-chain fatty acid transport protein
MGKNSFLLSLILCSGSSQAAGLYLYEIATEDTGLASAGMAARAQDASTVYSNPAGMTRLPDAMVTGGVQALYGDTPYTLDDSARVNGSGPGNVIGWFPGASLFYAQKINESFSAGIGLYGNYGLGLDFGNWAGSRLITKSTLVGMTLSPALAWKLNERLSMGFAPGLNYGYLSLTRSVDDRDEKQKDHDWAMNYRLGLLFDITEQTRAGLTWQSKTEYHFNINGKARFPNLPGSPDYSLPIAAQVNTPQQLMLSLVHDIDKRWSVMGNLGWQDWSAYGSNAIEVNGSAVSRESKLRDTWHTALGVQFRPDEDWRINAGIAYDSSFYRSQDNAALTMPSGEEWRYGIGAQYRLSPNSSLGAAFEYVDMASAKVSAPLVQGQYGNPAIYFVNVNYSYTF